MGILIAGLVMGPSRNGIFFIRAGHDGLWGLSRPLQPIQFWVVPGLLLAQHDPRHNLVSARTELHWVNTRLAQFIEVLQHLIKFSNQFKLYRNNVNINIYTLLKRVSFGFKSIIFWVCLEPILVIAFPKTNLHHHFDIR